MCLLYSPDEDFTTTCCQCSWTARSGSCYILHTQTLLRQVSLDETLFFDNLAIFSSRRLYYDAELNFKYHLLKLLLYSPAADFTKTASRGLIVPLDSCGCLREVYVANCFAVCFVWVLLAAAIVGTSPLLLERLHVAGNRCVCRNP